MKREWRKEAKKKQNQHYMEYVGRRDLLGRQKRRRITRYISE